MFIKYTVVILYFGVLFLIGYFASRKVKDAKDYLAGGKGLGFWVTSFSASATAESSWLLLGLTGMGAMIGFKAFWAVIGEVIGVGFCWFVMAKRFKWFTDVYDSLTVPDFLASRFQSKSHYLRFIAAFVLSVFVVIYVSAQIDATGTAFEAFLEIDYYWGIAIGFFIVVAYTTFGGFVAVAWSDFFQGILMFFGLFVLPFFAYFYLPESNEGLFDVVDRIDPNLLSIWGEGGMTLLNVCGAIGLIAIGLAYLGSPQIFMRFIAIKDKREIEKGSYVAFFITLFVNTSAVFAGIIGRVLVTSLFDNPLDQLGNGGQNVLPLVVNQVFPMAIIGLYIAAVLSAIMSTIDSLLILASSAASRDVYQKIYNPSLSSEKLGKLSTVMTLVLALISLAIAIVVSIVSPTRTIYWFVLFGFYGIAAIFCPVVLMSLYWKKFTENGAIASMLIGFTGMIFFKFFATDFPVVGIYIEEISPLPFSFILSFALGIWVSLRWPSQKTEERFVGEIDQFESEENKRQKEQLSGETKISKLASLNQG